MAAGEQNQKSELKTNKIGSSAVLEQHGVIRDGVHAPSRTEQQQSLDEMLLLLNRVVHAAVTSIVVTDPHLPDNPIVYHNPAFERISGYQSDEIDGRNCRFLQGKDTDRGVVRQVREAIATGQIFQGLLLNYRKDGTPFWNELNVSPVLDESGRITHFVGVQHDVTRRAEAEKERDTLLAQQQRIAQTLQRALLLKPIGNEVNQLQVATKYEAAHEEAQVGGDFFDAVALSENRVALIVGDCTGKGLQAAQYTAEVKYALRVLLREYGHPTPAMHRLNTFLMDTQRLDEREDDALVCAVVAVIDTITGETIVVAGGMEPPLVVRADGSTEAVEAFGMILGADANAEYTAQSVTLGEGDMLALFTDGYTEARSPRPNRELFGYERLTRSAREAITNQSGEAPNLEIVGEQIAATVRQFAGGKVQDDMCLLLARRVAAEAGTDSSPLILSDPEVARLGEGSTAELLVGESTLLSSAQENSELAHFALEVTGLGYWELDTATGVIRRSARHDQIFGYTEPPADWNYQQFLARVHPDDYARVDALYGRALAGGTDWNFECRILRAGDGELRWIETQGRHFRVRDVDAASAHSRIIGTVADITERKQIEQENDRLREVEQEAAQRQRRFLREMLYGFTEGHLRLCDTISELPQELTPAYEFVPLAPPSLRVLRRQVLAVGEEMGFDSERLGDLETAVGEAAMNAIQHGDGERLGRVHTDSTTGTIQVWVTDMGTGISENLIHRAVESGWTTGGFGQGFHMMWKTCDRLYLLTGPTGTTVVLEMERTPPLPPWMANLL